MRSKTVKGAGGGLDIQVNDHPNSSHLQVRIADDDEDAFRAVYLTPDHAREFGKVLIQMADEKEKE